MQRLPSISPRQLDAASTIYSAAPWDQPKVDAALYSLRRAVPDWDFESVLVMAASVNQLCNAGHPRLVEATERILQASDQGSLTTSGTAADIVTKIGVALKGEDRSCYYWPFASKFAHFLVSEDVPIYDRWALKAVEFHRPGATIADGVRRYDVFARLVGELREAAQRPTARQLDWFLWLFGMYRAWDEQADPAARETKLGLGRAVKALFATKSGDLYRCLRRLLPR